MTPREKLHQPEDPEEGCTRDAAPSRTASPKHYQLCGCGPHYMATVEKKTGAMSLKISRRRRGRRRVMTMVMIMTKLRQKTTTTVTAISVRTSMIF